METTSQHSHLRLRIPSFVANCERLLRQYERERLSKSASIATDQKASVRTAARVDANQSMIVKALRGVGAFVQPLHTVGDGCPDLLVCYRGKTLLIEVKDGDKVPSQRKLTKDEEEWHAKAASKGTPVFIAENIEDALVAIGAVTVME